MECFPRSQWSFLSSLLNKDQTRINLVRKLQTRISWATKLQIRWFQVVGVQKAHGYAPEWSGIVGDCLFEVYSSLKGLSVVFLLLILVFYCTLLIIYVPSPKLGPVLGYIVESLVDLLTKSIPGFSTQVPHSHFDSNLVHLQLLCFWCLNDLLNIVILFLIAWKHSKVVQKEKALEHVRSALR